MEIALEVALAAGIVVVGASFLGVVLGRISDGALKALTASLTGVAGVAGVVLAVGLAIDRWDWRVLSVAFGGLVAAAAAEAGALGLSRGLARIRAVEDEGTRALERLESALAAHAEARIAELDHTLARERAETTHLLVEQERTMREEGRGEVDARVEQARGELLDAVGESQQRLESRLSAWSDDLERAQQQLKTRLEELIRKQAEALQGHEARLADHAREVESLEAEQNAAIARLRTDLDHAAQQSLETMQAELEIHASDRRRALHEVSDRLRTRERSMREQIEREETEFRGQLGAQIAEVERRQLEQLERAIDRAVVRLSEEAERRFDAQLKESREQTADRLGRELELQMDQFIRGAEQDVATRIAEAAQSSASKLQRHIDDVVRTAEAQTDLSNDRIRALSERLERSLEAAHERLGAFEEHVELELSAKLAEIERALRAAGQSIERA